jgi:hypothetical protein
MKIMQPGEVITAVVPPRSKGSKEGSLTSEVKKYLVGTLLPYFTENPDLDKNGEWPVVVDDHEAYAQIDGENAGQRRANLNQRVVGPVRNAIKELGDGWETQVRAGRVYVWFSVVTADSVKAKPKARKPEPEPVVEDDEFDEFEDDEILEPVEAEDADDEIEDEEDEPVIEAPAPRGPRGRARPAAAAAKKAPAVAQATPRAPRGRRPLA